MKKIFAFIITLTMVLSFPVFACASSDSVQGGIYMVIDDYTLQHSENLDGKSTSPEVPYGTTYICGDYSGVTYNPKLLSSFKATVTFENEKISVDLYANNKNRQSNSVTKGGIIVFLENKACPRLYVLYSEEAKMLGNNTLSLAEDYKVYAQWTYNGTKYEASLDVTPEKGGSFASFSALQTDSSYKSQPLAVYTTGYFVNSASDTYTSVMSVGSKKSYYAVSMSKGGQFTFTGCDENPNSEIFKSEQIYYQKGTSKKKITCLSVTVPDNLDESKVYNLKFKNSDGLEITRPVTLTVNLRTPLKVSNVKAVSTSGALKTSWNVTGGSGYQIQVATNKSFTKNAKTYTVNNSNTKSKKIKSLTRGKTYYVRVRAINAYNGNKVYGAWSSVVKAKL